MDQDVINLAKAIRQHESGGDFNAVGDNGTSRGAYQWQAATWKGHAKQILGDENAPMTRDNQQAVAYGVMKTWKDQGLNPAQIAAKWNSGSDKGWENKIGTTTINGKPIAYNVPQYVKSVTDNYQRFKAETQKPSLAPSAEQTSSQVGNTENPLVNFGVGIGSAIGKTALNIPKAIIQGTESLLNIGSGETPRVDFSGATNAIENVKNAIYQKPFEQQLDTTAGKGGEIVGTVAPFLMTGGVTSGLANTVSGARMFQGAGALPAVARVASGAATEALTAGAQGYLYSGGNTEQAKTAALFGGATKGLFSGIGEIAKSTKVPQAILGPVFKIDKTEAKRILNTDNAETFNDWALNKGLKGNTQQVATQVASIIDDSESKIFQEFANKGYPSIYVEDPKRFISAIENKASLLEKSGATEQARNLKLSVKNIDPETGAISPVAALSLRRFLDGLRIEKSFLSPTEELSAQQAGLKEMTDELRHKINSIGGVGDTMKDYSKALQAMEALAKKAKSENNSESLGLIGNILLGESIASASPTLAATALARKAFNTTSGRTNVAQTIKNLPKSSAFGSAARGASGTIVGRQQAQ